MKKIVNKSSINLGDIATQIIDRRGITPKKLGGEFSTKGHPVITADNIKDGGLIRSHKIRYISNEMYQKWMKFPIKEDDILLTSEGSNWGETYLVTKEFAQQNYAAGQRIFCISINKSIIDPTFVYLYLSSKLGQFNLKSRETGSTAKGIRKNELLKIEIPNPQLIDIKILKEINNIEKLTHLNKLKIDKILNFLKSNFHIKVGKYNNIYETSKPPLNWRKSTLEAEQVVFQSGMSYTSENLKGQKYFMINSGNFALNDQFKFDNLKTLSETKIENKYFVTKNDLVINGTDGQPRQFIGKPLLIPNLSKKSIISNDLYKVISKKLSNNFLYLYFLSEEFREPIRWKSNGTRAVHIFPEDLNKSSIVVPDDNYIQDFERSISPYFELITLYLEQIRVFNENRSTLIDHFFNNI